MPVVHQYKNGRGFYLKANQGGKITTYQVTKEGAAVLKGHGHGDGSSLSPAELARLREQGHVTTGGSGPGEMEPAAPTVPPLPPPTAPKKNKQSRRERKRLRQAAWFGTSTPHAPSYSPPAWVPPPPAPPPPPLWLPLPDDTDEEWLVLPPLDRELVPRPTENTTTGGERREARTLPLGLTSPRNRTGGPSTFPLLESEHRPESTSPERSPVAAAPPISKPPPSWRPAASGRDARQEHSPAKLPGSAGRKTFPRRGTEPAAEKAIPRLPAEREELTNRSVVKRWLALALAVLLVFPAWLLVAGLLALLFLPKDASLVVKAAAGVVVVGTAAGAAVIAYRSERE